MKLTNTEARLLDDIERLPTIDAHSHLPIERVRLTEHADALTFYRQYTRLVMFAAGLDEAEFLRMHDPETPLDERFDIFERYYDLIRHSSAARSAAIALARFYGEQRLTRDNFDSITARMRQLYRPGVLYHTVLREACGIRAVAQNAPPDETDFDDPLMRVVPMIGLGGEWNDYNDLAQQVMKGQIGGDVEDYVETLRGRLRRLRAAGAIAFKHFVHPYCETDAHAAQRVWESLRHGEQSAANSSVANPLLSYLSDEVMAEVARLAVPLAVHSGVWGDFREFDPQHFIPCFQRHPDLRFDLFHMGIPYVRAMGRIAANFRNVWVNLCWAPTVSTTMTAAALDEWLDMVPTNKIIGFGSDVRWPVEKVYGHLTLARQTIASVLALRIDRGLLDHDEAIALSRQWLFDNPGDLYGLRVERASSEPLMHAAATSPSLQVSACRDM